MGPVSLNAQKGENPWAVSLALGYGYDFDQLSPNSVFPFPLVITTSLGDSEVRLGAPWSVQLGAHIPFGKRWGMETGVGMTSRSIRYETLFQNPLNGQCQEYLAGINLRMYRVPILLDWIPLKGNDWRFHLKAGLSVDWSGMPDDVFYGDGPSSLETPSKVEVFDLNEEQSFMLLITDDALSASALAGLEWEYNLGKPGRLALGLTFSHQLNSSTSLLLWGYDRKADNREGGYVPNILQFTSVMGYVRYAFAW
ncbi:MAG: outer membrane beta-barrel protein [Saprospirales bacterium]|nr:outer membrane beta-barrel protein [Saprospirales bacterium]